MAAEKHAWNKVPTKYAVTTAAGAAAVAHRARAGAVAVLDLRGVLDGRHQVAGRVGDDHAICAWQFVC